MKQSEKKGEKNIIGAWGEEICCNYFKNRGFEILETNYLKPYGEIDVIAREKTGIIHFVEVKTVSHETKQELERAVARGTWRPEENVHAFKLKKMSRVIEAWLEEKKIDSEWKIDVIAVRVVPREKYATVKLIENVIF